MTSIARVNTLPEDVLTLQSPTEGFLCLSTANVYGLEFLSFVIEDYVSKDILFEASRENPHPIDFSRLDVNDNDAHRKMHYSLPQSFLRTPRISTSLLFSNGPRPLENFRMIERHYFRQQLIKSFDFSYGLTLPHTVNTWEVVYDVPPLEHHIFQDMIKFPYETTSDTFYFVGESLVMHNKAFFKFLPDDDHE